MQYRPLVDFSEFELNLEMTDNKSLVVVPENSGYLKIVSCMSRGGALEQ